ncbi:hypothetical protein BC940DRAFT_302622 [Gongronella butleri]|nr:hypothetical protein BC940DRAFT_302622 [Gongronella butleri]
MNFSAASIGPDTLDDWLESDLRQSGILPLTGRATFDDTISLDAIKLEQMDDHSDGSKTVVGSPQTPLTKDDLVSPMVNVAPFLQALAFFTSASNNNDTNNNIHAHAKALPALLPMPPAVINPLDMTRKDAAAAAAALASHLHPLQQHISPNTIASAATALPVLAPAAVLNHIPDPTTVSASSSATSSPILLQRKRPAPAPTAAQDGDATTAPIEADAVAMKRQKNTDAARRSRLRKALKMEALEKRVAELEDANKRLASKVNHAEKERDASKDKVDGQEKRIQMLEDQLAKAHKELLDDDDHQTDKTPDE